MSGYGCDSRMDGETDFGLNSGLNRGNLVMIGGGPRPASIMEKIVSLSPDSTFIVVPMASEIADTIGWEHRDMLLSYGAKEARIMMLTDNDINRPEILEQIRNASGIWFSGGDQRQLMHYFGTEEMKAAVRHAYDNGAVIAGTSAGTAVQSKRMITGDEAHGFRQAFGQIRHENVITSEGLGLVSNLIVDQHFIRRSRLNRLINVMVDEQIPFAAGIDEATALWIKPDGLAEVIGESQVMLIDGSEAFSAVYPDRYLGITGLVLHVLPTGSRFRLQGEIMSDIYLPVSNN
ncbi:MAG: cyanophycinase [Balneolales bacterium]|nr:cyanophycinase [Balneolales bacterium]